jgi:hypothetical protein
MVAKLAAAAAVACIALAPSAARAQTPYWEDQAAGSSDTTSFADSQLDVKWHAGIRVGRYIPGIDAQLSGIRNNDGQGPYEAMFGGYSILPMLDVDRFLWTGFGQAGVGVSIGYLGKSAHAWADCVNANDFACDPANPDRMRSAGDKNTFRLIPIQITGVYRFSYLDDEWGIPIVPYVRAGFGYYVWWMSAPNGDFAKVCSDGGMEPNCSQNKAVGGTFGIVGTAGLAIRAERIDASAARSMQQSGIEHAGFYAEINAGKVDGFSSKKLSVGDTTLFGGVDFEF